MDKSNIPSRIRPHFRSVIEILRDRMQLFYLTALASIAFFFPVTGISQDILNDVRGEFAYVLIVVIALILFAGFCVAAYVVIQGVVRIAQDREGGVNRFAIGIVAVIVMIVLTVYFADKGIEQIGIIRTGS